MFIIEKRIRKLILSIITPHKGLDKLNEKPTKKAVYFNKTASTLLGAVAPIALNVFNRRKSKNVPNQHTNDNVHTLLLLIIRFRSFLYCPFSYFFDINERFFFFLY